MKKQGIIRLIATFLVAVMMLTVLLACNKKDDNPQGFRFDLQKDRTYAVSRGDACNLKNVVIPDTYKKRPVTGIAADGFRWNQTLNEITIPDSVTWIGAGAFGYCLHLSNVIIPDSVTLIGRSAFVGCISLVNFNIGNGVTSIGESAFAACTSLKSVTIGDSVTDIGRYAFSECKSLTSIEFKGTIKQWNSIAFGDGWNWSVPATEVICSDGVVPLT